MDEHDGVSKSTPYRQLTPDRVLDAIEHIGLRCDGRLLALNSYENRVYQAGLEDGRFVVAKFYRPGRWSDDAIVEEHSFTRELAEREVPVALPITGDDGATLHHVLAFRVAVYPRIGGHWPPLEDFDALERIGRWIGRLHAIGAAAPFRHRPCIDVEHFGVRPARFLLDGDWIPGELVASYRGIVELVLDKLRALEAQSAGLRRLRLHGDCHPGNILWSDDGPCFVDFDDTRTGLAVQDLWMLLSGDRAEMTQQLSAVLDGYGAFHDFDARELRWIEPLRTLRMIHYSAWIAQRWGDPAFPHNFPWFNTQRYWEEQILTLREQAALLDEPPLQPG